MFLVHKFCKYSISARLEFGTCHRYISCNQHSLIFDFLDRSSAHLDNFCIILFYFHPDTCHEDILHTIVSSTKNLLGTIHVDSLYRLHLQCYLHQHTLKTYIYRIRMICKLCNSGRCFCRPRKTCTRSNRSFVWRSSHFHCDSILAVRNGDRRY